MKKVKKVTDLQIDLIEDKRDGLITSPGDENNAFLKRFHLQPFAGPSSGLRRININKELEEEGESSNG